MHRSPEMLNAMAQMRSNIGHLVLNVDYQQADADALLHAAMTDDEHVFMTPPSPTNRELRNIVAALSLSAPVALSTLHYNLCQTRDRVNALMSSFAEEAFLVEDFAALQTIGTKHRVPNHGVSYVEQVTDSARIQLNMLTEAALVGSLIDIFCFDQDLLKTQTTYGKRAVRAAVAAMQPVWDMGAGAGFTREVQYIPRLIGCMDAYEPQVDHVIEKLSEPFGEGDILH